MRSLASGLTILLSLASAYGQGGERGTAGKTTGEPGQGDHGQGMKGLGGGSIEVLCAPQQVAKGKDFTVSVKYRNDIKRPVDVHVDVLNAHSKAVYAGQTVPMDFQEGTISVVLNLPQHAEEPFLWKVFTTPRGEPFPNMIAESGMAIHLGDDVVGNCPFVGNYGSDPNPDRNVDFVALRSVPATAPRGGSIPVTVEYNLASQGTGTLVVSIMYKGPNTLVNSAGVEAQPGKHTVTVNVAVPGDVRQEAIYVIATLTPPGQGWENRLGEDRTYNINLGRRMLRN